MTQCKIDGCENSGKLTHGMCKKHYRRQLRTGSPYIVRPPGDPGKGRRKHPMYGAWAQMINRCYNPNNSSYGRYGAVGIGVCIEWQDDFLNFLADMGERPKGMTLDRIDTLGNYEPGNCRWATAKMQRQNTAPTSPKERQNPKTKPHIRERQMRKIAGILNFD